MFQTPTSPGEPARRSDGDIRWFEPVFDTAEGYGAISDSVAVAPVSGRRSEPRWRDIQWVGFGAEPERAAAAIVAPVRPEPEPAAHAAEASPAAAPAANGAAPRRRPAAPMAADRVPRLGPPEPVGLARRGTARNQRRAPRNEADGGLWRRVGASIGRVLRLGAATASVGVVAVFAYEGADMLGGLLGALPRGVAATVTHSLASFAAPVPRPEPAVPPGDPLDRASEYLDRAKSGDPVAQYNLAVLYARGDGLAQDFFTAASWFREAAINGHAPSQFNLGVIYERGLGVRQNVAEAVSWYRRAAESGYAPAQYNLGLAFAEGRGAAKDAVTAASWYRRAAEQGVVPAMVNFAILYERGEGVERSAADAYAWYRAAARRGDTAAERRASELFQKFPEAGKRLAEALTAAIAGAVHDGLTEPSNASGKAAAAVPAGPDRPVVVPISAGAQPAR